MENIILTGSAGFVGQTLYKKLKKKHNVIGIDIIDSDTTDVVCDIGSSDILNFISNHDDLVIINCAAVRSDYNTSARTYFKINVEKTKNFLEIINSRRIKKIIHISSVAALDGLALSFSNTMNCDDAYRVTKYLQQSFIEDFCSKEKIDYIILIPSAIYDSRPRSDTNIGKLQLLMKYLPFFPKIDVFKSLTDLDNFTNFIISKIEFPECKKFLTIEFPVKTVSQIVSDITPSNVIIFNIPYLRQTLNIVAVIFEFIGKIINIDPKITKNRVKKLFKDTSYRSFYDSLDTHSYGKQND
jgi:nucleoside-diphosphate-sugar epimerase